MTLVLSSSAVLGTAHHSVPGLIPQVPHISPGGRSAHWHPGPAALMYPWSGDLGTVLLLKPPGASSASPWSLATRKLVQLGLLSSVSS